MSRMYIGAWNMDIKQDFRLDWVHHSFMEKTMDKDKDYVSSLYVDGLVLSVFTSTTVTIRLLAGYLDFINKWNRGLKVDNIWQTYQIMLLDWVLIFLILLVK